MNFTAYHAKYFAHELTKRSASDSLEKLASALVDAQVDLNPHQGDFGLVRPPELEICNRFMAYSLFKPFADGELSGTGFLESLRDEMSNILLQKTAIMNKLNTLQLQAETLWIKLKSSH